MNSSTVVYQVSLRPPQHELQVEMTLRGPVARGRVKLQIPTWVPGDYNFAPQARDLFDVKARCEATGKALALRRDGWQGYVVEEGAGSLDTAFAAFYERFAGFGRKHAGYTTQDVLSFFGDLHPPLAALIAAAVEHPAGLATPDQLRALGFEVALGPSLSLGLVFQNAVGPSVYGVFDDSPAGAAGLAPGDVISAIDHHAFSTAALTWVGARSEPVTLGVQRGHRNLSFTLTPAPRDRIQSLRWKGTAAERDRICEWLGQARPDLVEGEDVDLGFYESFHGVEIVV